MNIAFSRGRPSNLKHRIAILMSDGRERTHSDIHRGLGVETTSLQFSASDAVRAMHAAGLLIKDRVGGVVIWRRA